MNLRKRSIGVEYPSISLSEKNMRREKGGKAEKGENYFDGTR